MADPEDTSEMAGDTSDETAANELREPYREDKSVSVDDIQAEPRGVADVKNMSTTLGAAASGVLIEEDAEQAQLRVHDAQVVLAALGYLEETHGRVRTNGGWDPQTRDAVTQFQFDRGMSQNGQLDAETYEALLAEHEWILEMQSSSEAGEDAFSPMQTDKPLNEAE